MYIYISILCCISFLSRSIDSSNKPNDMSRFVYFLSLCSLLILIAAADRRRPQLEDETYDDADNDDQEDDDVSDATTVAYKRKPCTGLKCNDRRRLIIDKHNSTNRVGDSKLPINLYNKIKRIMSKNTECKLKCFKTIVRLVTKHNERTNAKRIDEVTPSTVGNNATVTAAAAADDNDTEEDDDDEEGDNYDDTPSSPTRESPSERHSFWTLSKTTSILVLIALLTCIVILVYKLRWIYRWIVERRAPKDGTVTYTRASTVIDQPTTNPCTKTVQFSNDVSRIVTNGSLLSHDVSRIVTNDSLLSHKKETDAANVKSRPLPNLPENAYDNAAYALQCLPVKSTSSDYITMREYCDYDYPTVNPRMVIQ